MTHQDTQGQTTAPEQQKLDVGERTQDEYDFIAEAIARFEDGIEAEQLRQAAREPYHPTGPFGAFTELDLRAAIAAKLEHGELRVFLVHVIEFGRESHHTTASDIIRAKAGRAAGHPISRHVYVSANRKLRTAGVIDVKQRWHATSVVSRPQPRLHQIPISASQIPISARVGASQIPTRGVERRGTGEVPERAAAGDRCVKCHGPTDVDADGEPWKICPGCNPKLPEARRAAWLDKRTPAASAGPAPPLFTEADAVRDALHRGEGVEL